MSMNFLSEIKTNHKLFATFSVRQEIDRRIQEKEDEFENTRKNHIRTLDALQGRLEEEAKAKAEVGPNSSIFIHMYFLYFFSYCFLQALRMKKKLEADINELEHAVENSNKTNAEAQKTIKRYVNVSEIFVSYNFQV